MKKLEQVEELRTKYGKGFDIIRKMGFKGGGLGIDGTGISEPIQIDVKSSTSGFNKNKLEREVLSEVNETRDLKVVNLKTCASKDEVNFEQSELHDNLCYKKKFYLDNILETISIYRENLDLKNKEFKKFLMEKQSKIEEQDEYLNDLINKKHILQDLNIVIKELQKIFIWFQYNLENVSDNSEITCLFPEFENSASNNNRQDQIELIENIVKEFIQKCIHTFENCKENSLVEISKSYLPYCSILKDILSNILYKFYDKEWNIKKNPDFGISMWVSIKSLFVLFETDREEMEYNSKNCFDKLINILSKALEKYFICLWDPIKDNEFGLSLLGIWNDLIPEEYLKTRLLEEVIWKRHKYQLQLESEDNDDITQCKWIFIWLPYYNKHGMGYEISKVISKHIDRLLEEWSPPETWPITILSIWKPILESKKNYYEVDFDEIYQFDLDIDKCNLLKEEFTSIIINRIYPRLVNYLNNFLIINSNYALQNHDCIHHLELWFNENLIDKSISSQLFVECIGPKWIECLHQKLTRIRIEYKEYVKKICEDSSANISNLFQDLLNWYKFWRQKFSDGVLSSTKTKIFLIKGLIMIDFHINYYSNIKADKKFSTNGWINYEMAEDSTNQLDEESFYKKESFIINLLEWVSGETGLIIKNTSKCTIHGKKIYCIEYGRYMFNNNLSKYFKVNPKRSRIFLYIEEGIIYYYEDSNFLGIFDFNISWNPISIPALLEILGIKIVSE